MSKDVRNVCLMSHGKAGKTTFLEAALYQTGTVDRFGKVDEGNTTSDYDPEEIKRKNSISLAVAPVEFDGTKINFIDTPGYFDFVGEVIEGISAADCALILVSGDVAVGTEHSWKYAKEREIPVMFFVNKLDDENSNFQNILDQLKSHFGTSIAPFQFPIRSGGKLTGYIDIVNNKAYSFDGQKEIPFTDEFKSVSGDASTALMEAIAESDEALMEKFFDGEEFTHAEIVSALSKGIKSGDIVPVFLGSAYNGYGIKPVLQAIEEYAPKPADMGDITVTREKNGEIVKVAPKSDSPLNAQVFKTIADPFVGKLSIFRVYSGIMKANTTVYNATKQTNEKIGKLYVLRGKKQIEADAIEAGDIGAVTKLAITTTGDSLSSTSDPCLLPAINFPQPNISLAIMPTAKGDEEKISGGLHKLEEEDVTFKLSTNLATHQMLISGIGEQHLDVIVSKLKAKFGVSVTLSDPVCEYRETIRKKVKVEGKHKKQSGGHGQYGHVWIEFEPGDTEELQFEEKIFGGSVPKNYHPAVEKGLRESAVRGVLAGYPMVNLKATLVDGSYHDVDSSEMAFKIAASLAYKNGLKQANPALLEPIGHLEVKIPDSMMGDIVGDINKRRGRILGMSGGEVTAEVPMAEMFKYATDLRSMTQARGTFTLKFERYEEAPANIAQKVIETSKLDED